MNALINDGPDAIPITAIYMLRPRLLKTQSEAFGMAPTTGRLARSQPMTRPMISDIEHEYA